ncbi:WD-40 repeat protein [Parafrankia sp. EAN1pec]|nr:WD-40 repeat protein [Frankia sp. EAN1pec]
MVTGYGQPTTDRTGHTTDFFVSYAAADQEWAEWIGWQLEAAGYRIRLRAWDFTSGSNIVTETQRVLATSAKMIAVMSSAYLVSAMESAQWQAVWVDDPTGAKRRLVVVQVQDCPQPGLLRPLVGVPLFGLDEDTARERLLGAAAASRQKPTGPPPFPASAAPDFPDPYVTGGGEPRLSPFPGLAAFDTNRAAVFRGREAATRHLVDRTLAQAETGGLIVVVGPSGCGKSSLVAAGLAPRMAGEADWLVTAPMTPGDQPIRALAVVLADAGRRTGLDWDAETLTRRLADPADVGGVAAELLTAARPARWLLLLIDQVEELLVRASPADRDRFLILLAAADRARVRVVATLRSEYLDALLDATAPIGLSVPAETLQPLSRDLLPLVIAEPARMSGLHIEDELVAHMVADTGDGLALPLLAYTLQRLHLAAQAVATHVLSAALYEQIGGVQQALVEHAEAALAAAAEATGRTRQQVLAGLLGLVTVDTSGRPTRRRVPLGQLSDATRAALVPFVTGRLLVLDATPDGPVTVEVAHERLLAAWPPLAQAIADDAERLRQRGQVETAARDWQQAGRRPALLWSYSRATSVLDVLIHDDLTLAGRQFLTISRRQARRRFFTGFTLLTVLAMTATGLGIAAYLQRQTADDRRRTAVAERLLTLADNRRDTDPTTAMRLAVAAHAIVPTHEQAARRNLLQTLIGTPYLRTTHTSDTGPIAALAVGPGGLLASGSADGTMRLWDTSDPDSIRLLGAPPLTDTAGTLSLASGPGGLLAIGAGDAVRLWDARTPTARRLLGIPLTDSDGSVALGPEGLLATGGSDGAVRLWDIHNPNSARLLDTLSPAASDAALEEGGGRLDVELAFGPSGLLAASFGSGQVRLWDISDSSSPRSLGTAELVGPVYAVAFGPDGLLATGGGEGTVRLWDTSDPSSPRLLNTLLTGAVSLVSAVAFGPDGLLASGDSDGALRLWDTKHPTSPRLLDTTLTGTARAVTMTYGPDGLLATGSGDGMVQLWNTSRHGPPRLLGTLPSGLTGRFAVDAVAFGPDGLLATSSYDTGVRLWDISDPTSPRLLSAPRTGSADSIGEDNEVAFGPGGLLASVSRYDGTVRLWDTKTPASPRLLSTSRASTEPGYLFGGSSDLVAFGPDGLLASGGGSDGAVRLWDISDPTSPRLLGIPLTSPVTPVDLRSGPSNPVGAVAFGPGGLLAIGASDGAVWLWDTKNPTSAHLVGATLSYSASYPMDGFPIRTVLISLNGLLAIGGGDGVVRLWDIGDPTSPRQLGTPLTDPNGEAISANAAAFGPDGLLATGGDDGAVRLWDTTVIEHIQSEAVQVACQRAGRGLDRQEWARYLPGERYRETCPTGAR